MLYLLIRVLKRLVINYKIYLFVVLEIAIGVSIFVCGINSQWAMDLKLTEISEISNENQLEIQPQVNGEFKSSLPLAILYEDFEFLNNKYQGDVEMGYSANGTLILTGEKSGFVNVIFSTEKVLEGWLDTDIDPKKVYSGKGISKLLSSNNLIANSSNITISDGSFKVADQLELMIDELPNPNRIETISTSNLAGELFVEQTLFVPAELIKTILIGDILNPKIYINSSNYLNSSKVAYESKDYLSEKSEMFSFIVIDSVAQLEKGSRDLTSTINAFSWLAKFSLLIVTVGILGILLILLQRRTREMAISFALGATIHKILFEIFCEIFTVCMVGGLVGCTIGYLLTPLLSTTFFDVSFNLFSLLIVLGLMLLITTVTCFFSIISVKGIHPIKTLQGGVV